MTRARSLKKEIRARAAKTGESYTTARRQLLAAREKARAAPAAAKPPKAAAPAPAPPRKPPRGSLSDEKCRERTGHGLARWFELLDQFDAPTKGHTASARYLLTEHGVPSWYAQGITVAYEYDRGLREPNRRCDGGYEASISRVVPSGVAEVVRALALEERRERWLPGGAALGEALAAALAEKHFVVKGDEAARLRYRWGASTVELRVSARPEGKASVVAQNIGLSDGAELDARRAAWREALAALHGFLSGRGAP
jgi:hypothetical protein